MRCTYRFTEPEPSRRGRALPQILPLEFGEDRQQAGHGSTGARREIQRLGQ